MDSEHTLPKGSRKGYYGFRESQQKSSTREILQVGSATQCPTSVRPPPTGEDSKDTERSKGTMLASFKQESFLASPRMTPRRFSKKNSIAVHGHSGLESDEEKLAPLGFEPEGSAASTPQCERWPTSLSDVLTDCQGFICFYQFLRQENSEILLDFWKACVCFKRMAPTSPETRTTAKAIFQKFISAGSCDVLEIRECTKNKIAQHINDQPVDCELFEEALSEIMAYLKNDHYPRFMNTSLYKECVQSGGESPKDICDRFPQQTARFHGGYLPTLPEEKVLGFQEIEDGGDRFEFEQHRNKSLRRLSRCGKKSGSDERNARCLLHSQLPMKRILSEYHYPTAPMGSRIESENQSLSSDAMTEDTLSLTDGALTDDASSRCSGGRHRCSSRKKASDYRHDGMSSMPFIPRTQRIPKEARHPLASNPIEFAKLLTEKLEKVKLEQDLQEREARNLIAHSEEPKKSILQQAIEASSNKVPLSKIAMSVIPEVVTSYKDQYPFENASSGVKGSATSTSVAAEAANTYTQSNLPQQAPKSKSSTAESKEMALNPQPSGTSKGNNVWEMQPSRRRDEDIPFLTVNHHRIMQWMEEGEQAQQGSPRDLKESKHSRHHSSAGRNTSKSSRQSTTSSLRQSDKSSRHLPTQPIASDPLMPPLPVPHPSSVLEETKRILQMEVKEGERRSKHHPRQRSGGMSETSSHRGRNSASSNVSTVDFTDHKHAPGISNDRALSVAGSSMLSSVSHCDSMSKDSGFTGSVKKCKDRDRNEIVVTYFLWGEPIPYRTTLPGRCVTLGQFKTLLPPRKGSYRFYFKRSTEDGDCEVVYEEVKDDSVVLPTFDGKVVGKVERVDS